MFFQKVVMAFHACEGTESGDAYINLPQWVLEIGKENPDIFFTDREGRRNEDCLSWGIDKERVLRGRTGMEVMKHFVCYNTATYRVSNCDNLIYLMFYFTLMNSICL